MAKFLTISYRTWESWRIQVTSYGKVPGSLLMKRSNAQILVTHIRRIGPRALTATLILWILVSIPFPLLPARYFFLVQVPGSVFLFVIYIGKVLYDTFFYDRYGQ